MNNRNPTLIHVQNQGLLRKGRQFLLKRFLDSFMYIFNWTFNIIVLYDFFSVQKILDIHTITVFVVFCIYWLYKCVGRIKVFLLKRFLDSFMYIFNWTSSWQDWSNCFTCIAILTLVFLKRLQGSSPLYWTVNSKYEILIDTTWTLTIIYFMLAIYRY
jgi:hypothetical protein